MLFQLENSNKK